MWLAKAFSSSSVKTLGCSGLPVNCFFKFISNCAAADFEMCRSSSLAHLP
jgi:hypothetical protein